MSWNPYKNWEVFRAEYERRKDEVLSSLVQGLIQGFNQSPSLQMQQLGQGMMMPSTSNTGHGGQQGFSDMEIEPVATTVKGMRAWNSQSKSTLHSLTHSQFIWHRGKNIAECLRPKSNETYEGGGEKGRNLRALHKEKVIPVEECACGFWAYWGDKAQATYGQSGSHVIGIMEGWGKILIGDRGFRAQYARIVALHVPEDNQWIHSLKSQYPAVEFYDSIAEMVYYHPTPNIFSDVNPHHPINQED